jgi:hypothetical protein
MQVTCRHVYGGNAHPFKVAALLCGAMTTFKLLKLCSALSSCPVTIIDMCSGILQQLPAARS